MGSAKRKNDAVVGEHQLSLPLGVRLVEALHNIPIQDVKATWTNEALTGDLDAALEAVTDALGTPPELGFMHSALCAMSLPVRETEDKSKSVIRKDGDYTLSITPRRRIEPGPDGEPIEVYKGVPFGATARIILFFIMTEAIRRRDRSVYLGKDFSSWMRRMGYSSTQSGGQNSTRFRVQDQIERLMNCDWSVRYDGPPSRKKGGKGEGASTFFVSDMRLATSYAGLNSEEGSFIGAFTLSEEFYNNLLEHSVPLVENAFKALRRKPIAMDLYTWLAYRLPRIPEGETLRVAWPDLLVHFGSSAKTIGRFKQTLEANWDLVACVYPQARHSVQFEKKWLTLRFADPPTRGQLRLFDGILADAGAHKKVKSAPKGEVPLLPAPEKSDGLVSFPYGSISFGEAGRQYREIAMIEGGGWDVDQICSSFRSSFNGIDVRRPLREWLSIWESYCIAYRKKRE